MSYCRFSDKSDVYCFPNGETWVTHVAYDKGGQSFRDSSLLDFKTRLLVLRSQGLRVPDCALERIEGELSGIEY